MGLSSDLRVFLLADATIAGLVGTRIYPLLLPQSPTLPALTYQWISLVPVHSMDGPSGLVARRLQVDCWGSTYLAIETLAEAVRNRLDGYQGSLLAGSPSGSVVQGVFRAMERDGYEEAPALYRRTVDFMLHAEEAVT
jgi:hypothetical protein